MCVYFGQFFFFFFFNNHFEYFIKNYFNYILYIKEKNMANVRGIPSDLSLLTSQLVFDYLLKIKIQVRNKCLFLKINKYTNLMSLPCLPIKCHKVAGNVLVSII